MRFWLSVILTFAFTAVAVPSSNAQGNEPIKIGVLSEQSGFFSISGEDIARGARLYADHLNAQGGINGRQIEVIVQDTASEPERAVIGARKLIEQDKVVGIVGPGFIANILAVAPMIGSKGPIFYPIGIFNPPADKPLLFVSNFDVRDLMLASLQYLQKIGKTKVAFVSTNDATGQAAEQGFRGLSGRLGITPVAVEFFNPSATSVVAELGKIQAAKPDAVIAWTVGRATAIVAVGAQQLGMGNLPFVTTVGNLSGAFLKQVGEMGADFFVMLAPKDSFDLKYLDAKDPQYPMVKVYREAYLAKWKTAPGPLAGGAWDAMALLTSAIGKVGTDAATISKQLESTQGFVGAQGVFNLSPQNHRGIGAEFLIPVNVVKGQVIPAH
jgi:branched-chain amino acid transport system substrate-binding protein